MVSEVGLQAWASSLLSSNNNRKEEHGLNVKASRAGGRLRIRGDGRKSLFLFADLVSRHASKCS